MRGVFFETELGHCALAWSNKGIAALSLPDRTEKKTWEQLVQKTDTIQRVQNRPLWIRQVVAKIQYSLSGRPISLSDLSLDFSQISPFYQKVYRALRQTRYGQVITYSELAQKVGSAKATRAVGRAMASNPFPILVPCHRVIGKHYLGNFSAPGGTATKRKLLAMEGILL